MKRFWNIQCLLLFVEHAISAADKSRYHGCFWISLSKQTMNLEIISGKHLALNTILCLQKAMCNYLKECNLRLEFVLFSEKKEKRPNNFDQNGIA